MINPLLVATPERWLELVESDFIGFLQDHANNERKAQASALLFVVRYPDREALIDPLISLARDELLHFQQVYRLLKARGGQLRGDEKSPYLNALLTQVRTGKETRLLDRLLVAGIAETRGGERFGMLAEGLSDPKLRKFYGELHETEKLHSALYPRLAQVYFEAEEVAERHQELLEYEGDLVQQLPLRAAIY